MNNTDFMDLYDNYLAHRWVTSKDAQKAAQQKAQEKAYNKRYYEEHKSELLAKTRAGAGKRGPLSRDEANAKFDKQIEDLSTYYKLNPKANMADQIAVNKLVSGGMSKEDAREQVRKQRLSQIADDMVIESRNQRMAATARAQGEQIRKNYEAAQKSYAEKERQKQNVIDIAERNAKVSNAQAAATRNRKLYAQARYAESKTTEAKIKKSIEKVAKKVSNVINSGKAAVQDVKDFYNNAKADIKRASDFIKEINEKYFR